MHPHSCTDVHIFVELSDWVIQLCFYMLNEQNCVKIRLTYI